MTKESLMLELEQTNQRLYQEEEDRLILRCLQGIKESATSGREWYICHPNVIYTEAFNSKRFENVSIELKNKGFYSVIRRTVNDEVYLQVYLEAPKTITNWDWVKKLNTKIKKWIRHEKEQVYND